MKFRLLLGFFGVLILALLRIAISQSPTRYGYIRTKLVAPSRSFSLRWNPSLVHSVSLNHYLDDVGGITCALSAISSEVWPIFIEFSPTMANNRRSFNASRVAECLWIMTAMKTCQSKYWVWSWSWWEQWPWRWRTKNKAILMKASLDFDRQKGPKCWEVWPEPHKNQIDSNCMKIQNGELNCYSNMTSESLETVTAVVPKLQHTV